jgi:hypothetical protein
MALITVADVEEALGVEFTDQQELAVERVVESVKAALRLELGSPLEATAVSDEAHRATDFREHRMGSVLFPDLLPLDVSESNSMSVAGTALTEGTDYYLESYGFVVVGTIAPLTFTAVPAAVLVSYTAGLSDWEEQVNACLLGAAARLGTHVIDGTLAYDEVSFQGEAFTRSRGGRPDNMGHTRPSLFTVDEYASVAQLERPVR